MIVFALAWALALQADPTVTLIFGGDVTFGRVVRGQVVPIGGATPFDGVQASLRAADLAIVNLECVLTERPTKPGGIRLAAAPEAARMLSDAGVDLVTLANNHALDAGTAGFDDTVAATRRFGIEAIGGAPVIRRVGALRLGFIAATDRLNEPLSAQIAKRIGFMPTAVMLRRLPAEVAALAERVDVVVVVLHWGRELQPVPSGSQRRLAHALIDAGATLVVGHHAHVVQEIERYRQGLIAYSLGNLLFDMRAPDTRRRALLAVELGSRTQLVAYRLTSE